jgi:hypothetical protein
MNRVPLHFVAIPGEEILNACNRFNMPLETWRWQGSALGFLKKAYAKQAAIRGQQTTVNCYDVGATVSRLAEFRFRLTERCQPSRSGQHPQGLLYA